MTSAGTATVAGCPSGLPFSPAVSAGTADTQARASSPFTFDLTRGDRQDVITGVNAGLPGGLLAAVKDVPLCSDADANAGAVRPLRGSGRRRWLRARVTARSTCVTSRCR